MNRFKFIIISVIAAFASCLTANAYDFEVDGIYYNYVSMSDLTCEVTYGPEYIGDLVIPSTVEYDGRTFTVSRIGESAFNYCKNLTSVVLPESLTSIEYQAFYKCYQLTSVVLPESLISIAQDAFRECTSLPLIIIPKNVISLGMCAFYDCHTLKEVFFLGESTPIYYDTNYFSYYRTFYGCHPALEQYLVRDFVKVEGGDMTYSGEAPELTWTNNLKAHDCNISLTDLPKEAGTHEVILQAHFTRGVDFVCEIPYTYTISKAPLAVEGVNTTRLYGDENPTVDFSVTGFVNGETLDGIGATIDVECTANAESNVGEYPYSAKINASNYEVASVSGILTVQKAPLSVIVDNKEKVYGDKNPQLTVSYSGLKNADTESCFKSSPTLSTNATKESNVGNYEITATGGSAQNYEFASYSTGVLTVKKADLTITADNASRQYFEDNPAFTYSVSGLRNNDASDDALASKPTISCNATMPSECGEYEIRVTGGTSQNYALNYNPGVLTINKRKLTVTVDDCHRVYKEDNPEFVLKYSGFVNDESVNDLDRQPVVSCEADRNSDAGSYPIKLSGGNAQNYNFSYVSGTLYIDKAEQEIIWNQEFAGLNIGDQVKLTAMSTSGLDIEYIVNDNDVCSLYQAGGTYYLDCIGNGSVQIRATQTGNKNYYAAARVSKKVVVGEDTAIHGIQEADLSVKTEKGNIIICKKRPDTIVSIYSMAGNLIYRGTEDVIHVANGCYIVNVGRIKAKVIVD